MTLQWILDMFNFICDKEQVGKSVTELNYNTILPSVQWDKYTFEMGKMVRDKLTPIAGELVAMSALNPFMKVDQLTAASGGSGTPESGVVIAPSDYVRFLSFKTLYNGGYREITPVTHQQFTELQNNIYSRVDIHPVVKITSPTSGSVFNLLPFDVGDITLNYLRKPVTPYYDYCQDATTLAPVYMPVGSYVDLAFDGSPTFDLFNQSGVLYNNVYIQGLSLGTRHTSLTVELEWEEKEYNDFVLRLLSKAGVNLSEEKITAYAETKLKENAQV
jgi:hypothetical protein